MRQLESLGWHELLSADDPIRLAPELLDACRFASARIGAQRLQTIGVTSAIHGEGRTTVATALSLIQANDYLRQVILLELDLEEPSLGERLHRLNHPGLSELTYGTHSLGDVLQPAGSRFAVITAGSLRPDAMGSVLDRLASGLLKEIQQQAEVVIVDLPPILSSSFGSQAASLCQQIVMVVRADATPQSQVREAIDSVTPSPYLLLNGVQSRLPRWLKKSLGV